MPGFCPNLPRTTVFSEFLYHRVTTPSWLWICIRTEVLWMHTISRAVPPLVSKASNSEEALFWVSCLCLILYVACKEARVQADNYNQSLQRPSMSPMLPDVSGYIGRLINASFYQPPKSQWIKFHLYCANSNPRGNSFLSVAVVRAQPDPPAHRSPVFASLSYDGGDIRQIFHIAAGGMRWPKPPLLRHR